LGQTGGTRIYRVQKTFLGGVVTAKICTWDRARTGNLRGGEMGGNNEKGKGAVQESLKGERRNGGCWFVFLWSVKKRSHLSWVPLTREEKVGQGGS